jgi:bifunctional non-homologous end joining protein LigD
MGEHFHPAMSLEDYKKKRDFAKTPEPGAGTEAKSPARGGKFYVQRHDASHLHYDFRLEMGGALKSWAVPKGPSLDPAVKHFAAHVEDHPLDYGDFEGNIPKGSYGGGSVMLWDRGTFELIGDESGETQLARGDLKFRLHGEKLTGTWAIVKMKGSTARDKGKDNAWLLIKKNDEAAQPGWDIEQYAVSVKTGRTQAEIAADLPAKKTEKKAATRKKPLTTDEKNNIDPSSIPGAVRAPMPGFFAPMSASVAEGIPRGDNWMFEIKWDGVRGLIFIDDGTMTIYTRNNNRCELQYPELQVLPHYIGARQAILDGEIVVLDAKGVSKFELIQPRIHTRDASAIAKMAGKNPVHLYLFDLLYLDGFDLRRAPLRERKRALDRIVSPFELVRDSGHLTGSADDLLDAARQNGLEGLIAKASDSVYESRRTRTWLKLKVTAEQEFVIGGYTPGERDTFGSLAIGLHEGGKLIYAGNVGTGFTEKILRDLLTKMQSRLIDKMPFAPDKMIPKGTVWVKPELVAQVKFAEWTSDRKLRAPVYLGLREDKPPAEVGRETVVETLLPLDKKEVSLTIDGHALKFTNLDKLYFPDDGYTKRDLLNYYDAVSPLLLPHLKDRPLSLKRYPNGIKEEFFFQKNTPASYPGWLRTETIGEAGKKIRYVLADDRASLLYLTNLGCIDQNPSMSRAGSLENPDFILIDLDPHECAFTRIVEAALLVKSKLDAIGLTGYPKTTGGDGLHIYVPLEPHYTFEQARSFAEVIARLLAAERPDLFTTPRSVEKRQKNRVYFDYMQLAESKTISAPYVVRAYAGAPVATPLAWEEVRPELDPGQFTLANAMDRFSRVGDLFGGVLKMPQNLAHAFGRLEKLIVGQALSPARSSN